jgi:endonuclease III
LVHIEQQLTQVQKTIRELCENDPELNYKITRLTSIPGIGITVASITICELPELGNIEFNQ